MPKYTLGGDPPQSRSEEFLSSEKVISESRIEEILSGIETQAESRIEELLIEVINKEDSLPNGDEVSY